LGVKIKVATIIEKDRVFIVFLSMTGQKTVVQIVFSHQAKQHAKIIFSQNKPPKQENEKNKMTGGFSSSCALHK
jgi:hypothetical protein